MTTEDDFQNALDAHPDDWQTRLVFADWLEERDDPRAEGYRALGVLRARPRHLAVPGKAEWYDGDYGRHNWPDIIADPASDLAGDWYGLLPEGAERVGYERLIYSSRRGAEDAAALAFTKLPAHRRAELLAHSPA